MAETLKDNAALFIESLRALTNNPKALKKIKTKFLKCRSQTASQSFDEVTGHLINLPAAFDNYLRSAFKPESSPGYLVFRKDERNKTPHTMEYIPSEIERPPGLYNY